MTLKDLKTIVRQQDTPAGHAVLAALLASQKREREVFKRLSDSCSHGRTIDGRVRQFCFVNNNKCTMRTCPLLKEIK
jgi:hypothetical protein